MSASDHIARGPGYEFEFGGLIPVQGWGQIDGHESYFRARRGNCTVEVFAKNSGVTEATYEHTMAAPLFTYQDRSVSSADVDYMTGNECREHIAAAVAAFRLNNANVRRDFLRLLRARRRQELVVLAQRMWRLETGWSFFVCAERQNVITLTARRIAKGGDLWLGPLWRGKLRHLREAGTAT